MTKPALPSGGGSFVRNSDGSLTQQKPAKPAAKPKKPNAAAPAKTGAATDKEA